MDWINQLDHAIRNLVAAASTVSPWLCLLAVLVVLSLETSMLVGIVLPGEAMLLLAVAALGVRWAVPLFVVAILANIIGQSGGYLLGRTLGERLRRSWLGRKIGEQRWRSAEVIVSGSGGTALITTRFVAGVHAIVPAVVGTLRVPFRRFIVLAAIGAVLWAAVHTTLAVTLGMVAEVIGYGTLTVLLTLVGGCAAVAVLVRGARKRRRLPADVADGASRAGSTTSHP
ncbi:DedA family protein [Parasphingorhabdus pacifica]